MFGFAVVLLVALAFTVGQIVSVEKDYCYANDDNPYLNFGRRSSYHIYRGGKTNFQKIPSELQYSLARIEPSGLLSIPPELPTLPHVT